MKAISSSVIHNSHQSVIDNIQSAISEFYRQGIAVHIHWVAGHVNLEPNELADQAAKVAASQAIVRAPDSLLSHATVKKDIRNYIIQKWQREWNRGESGRETHELFPTVPNRRFYSSFSRSSESKLIRIASGHNRLNNHMHKLKLTESPCCECSDARQTVQHILMDCPIFTEQRDTMINEVESLYVRNQTPVAERTLDKVTLIAPTHTNRHTKQAVQKAFVNFLENVNCDF